jgi:hypothetical protein
MAFLQKQITNEQRWLRVETTQGTEFLPVDLVGDLPGSQFLADGVTEENSSDVQAYCEGKVQSWENIKGYGARLSAPGYLDCTEWAVFDTQGEAEKYLDEMFDDEDDNPEEN